MKAQISNALENANVGSITEFTFGGYGQEYNSNKVWVVKFSNHHCIAICKSDDEVLTGNPENLVEVLFERYRYWLKVEIKELETIEV